MACSITEALASSPGRPAIFSSKSASSMETGSIISRTRALIRSSISFLTLAPISVQSAAASSRKN